MSTKAKFIIALLLSLALAVPIGTASAQEASTSAKPLKRGLTEGVQSGFLSQDQDVLNFAASRFAGTNARTAAGPQFMVRNKKVDSTGQTHYLLQRSYKNIPVYGEYMQVNLNGSKKVYSVQNSASAAMDLSDVNATPELTSSEAIEAFKTSLEAELGSSIELETRLGKITTPKPTAKLNIYPYNGQNYLAYEVSLSFVQPKFGDWIGYVDATSGAVIDQYNKLNEAAMSNASGSGRGYDGKSKSLKVAKVQDTDGTFYIMADQTNPSFMGTFDYQNSYFDPNPANDEYYFINSKTTAFNDPAAVDAHFNTNLVYQFYKTNYGRESIDGKGMDILSFVHVDANGQPMDNAFWYGDAMFYGDGSGDLSDGGVNCMSCSLDVVAHELTHGVTEYTVGLEYRNQSGALNEAISDIMASVIDSDDWEMGENTGNPARSLANPGKYGQPAAMSEYVYLPDDEQHDNGGVHYNSGIPNHAAYLIATKIDKANIGLNGRKVLGQLTYNILNYHLLSPTANFAEAKDAYIEAVKTLPGLTQAKKDTISSKVRDAWLEVGVGEYVPAEDFALASANSTTAVFNWGALDGAESVMIQKSTDSGQTWTNALTKALPGSAKTGTVTGLAPRTDYLFRLDVTGGLNSGPSNAQAVRTAGIAITNFKNTSVVGAEASFAWSPAEQAEKVEILQSVDGAQWTVSQTTAPLEKNAKSATVAGLAPLKSYQFKLRVTGGRNEGDSNKVTVKTKEKPILDLTASYKGGSTADLAWTAPVGASAVNVQQSTDGGKKWTNAATQNQTATSATVKGLLAGTDYQFRLQVTKGENAGYSNATIAFTTPSTPMDSLELARPAATTSVQLKWTRAVNAKSIVLQQKTDTTDWTTLQRPTISAPSVSVTVSGLESNKNYSYRLVVTGGANNGTSNEVAATTAATPIASFSSSAKTDRTASFRWSRLAGSYTSVTIEQKAGNDWVPAAHGTIALNATEATVTDLEPSRDYVFRLALQGGAVPVYSKEANVTTDAPYVPIQELAVTKSTMNSVSLVWPQTKNAKKITVEAWDGDTKVKATTVSSSAKTATVSGLPRPNHTYVFDVVVEGGPYSGTSNKVEGKTAASPVKNFANTLKTHSKATFRWTTPVDASSVAIMQSPDDGSGENWIASAMGEVEVSADGRTSTATVTGLEANTKYKFKLVVAGGDNEGDSNVIRVTSDRAPTPIKSLRASVSKNAVTLSWPGASKADGIVVKQSADQASWEEAALDRTLSPSSTSAKISNLEPGIYYFLVEVTGGSSEGTSNIVTVEIKG